MSAHVGYSGPAGSDARLSRAGIGAQGLSHTFRSIRIFPPMMRPTMHRMLLLQGFLVQGCFHALQSPPLAVKDTTELDADAASCGVETWQIPSSACFITFQRHCGCRSCSTICKEVLQSRTKVSANRIFQVRVLGGSLFSMPQNCWLS